MFSWLFFAIIAQFLYAVVVLTDRFIVSKGVVSKPVVYAFYVNILSIFAIVALPFGVTLPTLNTIVISILVAIFYLFSIYFLYESLIASNPSEVVPVVGGVAALTAFFSSAVILNTNLPGHFAAGFIILTVGMLLISHFRFTLRSFLFLTGSGICFGLSTVLIKLIFAGDTFINGFFWSRMANVVIGLCMLVLPRVFMAIRHDLHKHGSKSRKSFWVVGNKCLAGLAFICTLVAIKLGEVSIVNALSATQYVFLLIFAIFFSRLLPEYFKETVHKHEFLHKSLATALIVIGFFVLFI